MSSIVPSFIAKLNRVEKHLHDLRAEIQRYGGADSTNVPFTVKVRTSGMRKVHRLHFTRAVVNTDVPVIAADAIYNLRSSLEHLMGALVANKDRDSVMFPIFWRGVWDAPTPGENDQRTKDRQRWGTISGAVKPEALEFLKRLQPPDDDLNKQSPHALRLLNQISNKDRHSRLPLIAAGAQGLIIQWRLPDGDLRDAVAIPDPDRMLEDGAEIRNVPQGAEYVKCFGPVDICVRTALVNQHGKVNLPVVEFVENTRDFILDKVIPPLSLFARV